MLQCESPVRITTPLLKTISTGRSPDEALSAASKVALFRGAQLTTPHGHTGIAGIRASTVDEAAACEAGLSPLLWGKWVAKRYYRRRPYLRGKPIPSGTYPPERETDRDEPILGKIGGDAPPADDARVTMGQKRPRGGHARRYEHGGVFPLHPPGMRVRVKLGGVRLDYGLFPLVNFGPAELLRDDFRESASASPADWYWKKALKKWHLVELDRPRAPTKHGDASLDWGGSHETVNFQFELAATHTIGRKAWGSLQKDCLDHTPRGKERRMLVEEKISQREVTNQTASTEGLILLMKLYLLSMASSGRVILPGGRPPGWSTQPITSIRSTRSTRMSLSVHVLGCSNVLLECPVAAGDGTAPDHGCAVRALCQQNRSAARTRACTAACLHRPASAARARRLV